MRGRIEAFTSPNNTVEVVEKLKLIEHMYDLTRSPEVKQVCWRYLLELYIKKTSLTHCGILVSGQCTEFQERGTETHTERTKTALCDNG